MNMKKKTLLFLIIALVVMVSVSLISVTYAWFLSRYSETYDMVLRSESLVVLTYETEIGFVSGTQSTSTNKITIATLKPSEKGNAFSPLDVFDVDTVNPAHTGKMTTAAQAVKFNATGAYWYGYGTESGALSFDLVAKPQNDATYDLVHYGELGYIVIFEYMSQKFLLYDGKYYTNSTTVRTGSGNVSVSGNETFPLTTAKFDAGGNSEIWYRISASTVITKVFDEGTEEEREEQIFHDGLLLLPNTQFAYTLYVFAAKPDDLFDQAWNGQTVRLEATISVPNPNV